MFFSIYTINMVGQFVFACCFSNSHKSKEELGVNIGMKRKFYNLHYGMLPCMIYISVKNSKIVLLSTL